VIVIVISITTPFFSFLEPEAKVLFLKLNLSRLRHSAGWVPTGSSGWQCGMGCGVL
jgi:hypothetical protein